MHDAAVIIAIVATVGVMALLIIPLAAKLGVVQLSHLSCSKCAGQFDYAWIPGASFTSIRLFTSRVLRCPICGQWSTFNVWGTRVDPKSHHCSTRVGPS